MTPYLGIEIDYERDKLIPEQGLVMLTKKGFYKRDWENSPQEGFARAATCYSFGDYSLAQRVYDYVSKGWFTFASPVLSNSIEIQWPTGLPFDLASDWLEENKSEEVDGMPISCFEAGTPVMTITGEKNIEDIRVGDRVLTHRGRFRKVEGVKISESSDIYNLVSSKNSTKLYVTGNHLMLTDTGWLKVSELNPALHMLMSSEEMLHHDAADNLTYHSIVEVTKLDGRTSKVYDIQVEEDESFSVAGVIAHNCFLNYIDDNKKSLVQNSTETRLLSMNGGGVGTYYGQRSPDEKSTGVMAHAKTYDADTVAYRQTSCYLGDTEVLTDSGWVKFKEIKGTEKVVAVDDYGKRFLEYPKEWLVSDYSGYIHNFYSAEGLDLHVTANHNMVVTHNSKLSLIRAEEILDLSSIKFTAFSGSKDAELLDLTRKVYPYEGKVYCCTVSTGKIIVRAGKVSLICGNSRRGSQAAYLDINHPEIMSFIDMRNPTAGGDSNTRCMNLNHGVNITDDFMHKMIKGENFELIDPKHGRTGRFLSAREVWSKLMEVRFETGEPYLNFIDTVNRNIPKWILNPLYKVVQSNLCTW